MNKQIKEEWLKRLKSGAYQRGKLFLKRWDGNTYYWCPLGVLVDTVIHTKGLNTGWTEKDDIGYVDDQCFLPSGLIVNLAGLTYPSVLEIVHLNDSEEYSPDFGFILPTVEKL